MLTSKKLLTTLAALPFAAVVVQAIGIQQAIEQAQKLPNLNADPSTVTVSGSSAGAHYATHLLTVLSDTFKGAGACKGGSFLAPYAEFRDTVQWPMQYHVDRAVNAIKELHEAQEIDDISNLANAALCIISGSDDTGVPPHMQEATQLQFEEFGMTHTKFISRADGHGWNSENAHLMIEFIYQSLGYIDSLVSQSTYFDPETLGTFSPWSQHEFYPESIDWTSDKNFKDRDNGYIFVPTACETTQCKVHFVLHGYGGSPKTGNQNSYNKVAALNNIIMVYPDTLQWENFESINDPENFMKNQGVMPMAFKKMVARLTGTEENEGPDGGDADEDEVPDGGDAEDEEGEGSDDAEDEAADEELDLTEWLQAQEIPNYEENCNAKFRITVVGDSGRLFHGHNCGTELNYTLVSQIQFPFGTWGSDDISDFSQEPDGPCEPISDFNEQCSFTLPPESQRLAIVFDPSFDLTQVNYENNWQ